MLRILKIKTATGITQVPVRIEAPIDDNGSWKCKYSIGWPEGQKHRYAMGYDAIQAVHSALEYIAMDLYVSQYHLTGTLYFSKPGDGYGFPLPYSSRDQAIGDDRNL